jgi:transcriptional regulator with XRE-family HTH domain
LLFGQDVASDAGGSSRSKWIAALTVMVGDQYFMEKKLARYLRPHRSRWRLTQEEVARLLGYTGSSVSSRIENGIRNPSLLDAFALEVVFGATPIELFPALFIDAEDAVLRRAKEMYEELQDEPSKVAMKKLELLEKILKRAIARLPPEE